MTAANEGEGLDELREALAGVEMAEASEERAALDLRGRASGERPRRMRNPRDRPVVARATRTFLDEVRVHDECRRAREHLARERKLVGIRLPWRRHAAVEHAVREQAAWNPSVPLHRGEIARPVLAADCQPGDEMVEDEVVQDDDPGRRLSASTIHPCASGSLPTW